MPFRWYNSELKSISQQESIKQAQDVQGFSVHVRMCSHEPMHCKPAWGSKGVGCSAHRRGIHVHKLASLFRNCNAACRQTSTVPEAASVAALMCVRQHRHNKLAGASRHAALKAADGHPPFHRATKQEKTPACSFAPLFLQHDRSHSTTKLQTPIRYPDQG